MFRDAETEGLFLLRIPGSGEPNIPGENDCIDRTVLRIVHIGKRTDSLLILKDSNAGERLGLASHAKAGDNRPGTSAAKRLRGRPFNERIGKDESAISAEIEVYDKSPQPWLVGNFRGPEAPAVPRLKPEVRYEFIGGLNVFGNLIHLGEESIAQRLESRIAQRTGGHRGKRSRHTAQFSFRVDEPQIGAFNVALPRRQGCDPGESWLAFHRQFAQPFRAA